MKTTEPLRILDGLSTLERPRFSRGLLLEADDLTAGVDYARNMMRLVLRSLFGCGIICGLDVTAKLTCNRRRIEVSVAPGVALDCLGNPIQVSAQQVLTYDPDCKPLPEWIWVTVCYAEKCCRPRDVSCALDDDVQVVRTRAADAFQIKLEAQRPECACSCAPPPEKGSEQATNGCCADEVAAPAATGDGASSRVDVADPRMKTRCTCYEAHNRGICACDCGCTCVVLARVNTRLTTKVDDTTKKETVLHVADSSDTEPILLDDRLVRRPIRPVLVGSLACPEHLPEKEATPKPQATEAEGGARTD